MINYILYNILYLNINIFRYITFRSGLAMAISFLFVLITMPKFIKFIQNWKQPIREDGPKTHLLKAGTPTMGGIILVLSTILSTLLFANLNNEFIFICLFTLISHSIIGLIDDIQKVKKQNSYKGLSVKMKLFLQFIFALIIVIWSNTINNNDFYVNNLTIPFFKNFILNLGIFYTIFRIIVIIGASNAVNITDGLDGLAIMPVIFNSFVLIIFCYFSGHAIYSKYLWLYHINNAGEICVFLSALIGASLGFLWFNAKPAEIFMGDSGSLAIGATLGTIAIITKNEILLAIIGGLFVIEAMSVIIQVCYFKLTKKRFFKMAPIHHHFEKIGWSETKVVIRFWIISLIFSLIGLLSLKLR